MFFNSLPPILVNDGVNVKWDLMSTNFINDHSDLRLSEFRAFINGMGLIAIPFIFFFFGSNPVHGYNALLKSVTIFHEKQFWA